MKEIKAEETLAYEKRVMKEKLDNEQRKRKDAENDRNTLRFEHEKSEIKWKSEKQNLLKRLDEYKETCEIYQHDNKKLSE